MLLYILDRVALRPCIDARQKRPIPLSQDATTGSAAAPGGPMSRPTKTNSEAARDRTRIGGRALATLLVMLPLVVLSQFLRSSIGVMAPDLMQELDLSPDDVGLLSGSFFFVFAALQIPVGI